MKKTLAILLLAISTAALSAQDIALPLPAAKSGVDLLGAIANRKVSKTFVKKDIPIADLSTILWAGLGLRKVDAVTSATKAGRNISFSGDNAYINIYVLTEKGSWKYLADKNSLQFINGIDVRSKVSPRGDPRGLGVDPLCRGQRAHPFFPQDKSSAFPADVARHSRICGPEYRTDCLILETGFVVQYTLKATDASEALKLGKDEVPLFIQQLGYTE